MRKLLSFVMPSVSKGYQDRRSARSKQATRFPMKTDQDFAANQVAVTSAALYEFLQPLFLHDTLSTSNTE